MSIPVSLKDLRTATAERGNNAYLLTVSDDARPHAVHTPLKWRGDALVAGVGKRTAANATARPHVSLLYPIRDAGDYSLIVDGEAAVESDAERRTLVIKPTSAILHRPAAAPDTTSPCGSDCAPVGRR